mmetsp:Transcript_3080/g.5686  ORF Transcript_3080/g.5686 Transcript_3080/m.5686 type:complete len:95 (+) Transcript_3080:432-716(+)
MVPKRICTATPCLPRSTSLGRPWHHDEKSSSFEQIIMKGTINNTQEINAHSSFKGNKWSHQSQRKTRPGGGPVPSRKHTTPRAENVVLSCGNNT